MEKLGAVLWLDLSRTRGATLSHQLYRQLVDRILSGGLKGGARLPSTRELAAHYRIARNIVIAVYEQLLAEGFLEARPGAGTFVARLDHLDLLARPPAATPRPAAPPEERRRTISFICGTPDLEAFPRGRWMTCTRQVAFFRETPGWGYAPPAGSAALRREVASHLARVKGIRCTPEQVVITAGTARALWITALLLGERRLGALVEDPVVSFVPGMLRHAGHPVIPVPTDRDGLVVDALPRRPKAALLFLSPSHHFPLGSTLPIQRRLAALEYARRHDIVLVEDDYDSEFRYEGVPVSSLFRLNSERVIHLGTFSKSLAPALRLGYIVVPSARVGQATALLSNLHLGASLHTQEAMARFIHDGHLDRQIVRMQRLYRRKMRHLVDALQAAFGGRVAISGNTTGLHLVATFPGVAFDAQTIARMRAAGVVADPVDEFALGRKRHPGALALGFGHLSFEAMDEGVRRLASVLEGG